MPVITGITPPIHHSRKARADALGSAGRRGRLSVAFGSLEASARISINKITHRFLSPFVTYADRIKTETSHVCPGSSEKVIRIVTKGEVLGRLPYYCVNDKIGNPKGGGSPASEYLGDDLVASHLSARRKKRVIRQLLAQLPAIPELMFCSTPNPKHSDVMVKAFKAAGFRSTPLATYTYFEEPNFVSLADRITGTIGKHVRAGRKNVTVHKQSSDFGADEFFDLYERNLGSKKNHFNSESDRALLRELTKAGLVHYIMLGRKDSDVSSVDTAMVCVRSKDGYIRIWRSTFPRGAGTLKSHSRANRYALVLAMDYAREMQMTLDTDGTTPGSEDLYRNFPGTLKPAIRHQFHYRALANSIGYHYPSIAQKAASYLPTKLASKFDSGSTPRAGLSIRARWVTRSGRPDGWTGPR